LEFGIVEITPLIPLILRGKLILLYFEASGNPFPLVKPRLEGMDSFKPRNILHDPEGPHYPPYLRGSPIEKDRLMNQATTGI
jgi:hypothetical protein